MAVAIWEQYRGHNNQPPLRNATNSDFVIVDADLHNELDAFNKNELKPKLVYLEMIELLRLYLRDKPDIQQSVMQKYGAEYLCLQSPDVDDLCQWVEELRDLHLKVGSAAFRKGAVTNDIL